jgi:hypothetical protein
MLWGLAGSSRLAGGAPLTGFRPLTALKLRDDVGRVQPKRQPMGQVLLW